MVSRVSSLAASRLTPTAMTVADYPHDRDRPEEAKRGSDVCWRWAERADLDALQTGQADGLRDLIQDWRTNDERIDTE